MDILTETVLPNGIPLVHIHRPHCRAEYIGVMVDAGARDESPRTYGLAHFVEHTIFKGTRSRSSLDILCTMEEVGGELNAYTTKEETVVYTAAPTGNARRSMSLIADLLSNATFYDSELRKERQVVIEEIESYRDIPSESVYDDFESMLFKGSQLGHNILGTIPRLRGFTSTTCIKYADTHFIADKMVAIYMGPEQAEAIRQIAIESLALIPAGQPTATRITPGAAKSFRTTKKYGSHQAHTVLGTTAPSLSDRDRYAWSLMTNILGGPGMNSLLNIALRESKGLAYTVEANYTSLTDTGIFSIYYGCDTKDISRCEDATAEVIARLAESPMDSGHLLKAKKQLAGQLLLGSESALDYTLSLLKSRMRHGRVLTLEQRIASLDNVTADDIVKAADNIRISNLSSLTLL